MGDSGGSVVEGQVTRVLFKDGASLFAAVKGRAGRGRAGSECDRRIPGCLGGGRVHDYGRLGDASEVGAAAAGPQRAAPAAETAGGGRGGSGGRALSRRGAGPC